MGLRVLSRIVVCPHSKKGDCPLFQEQSPKRISCVNLFDFGLFNHDDVFLFNHDNLRAIGGGVVALSVKAGCSDGGRSRDD